MPVAKAKLFPLPPRLYTLLGPSFIILALGLGSGEVILWPYLVANHGLGVAWAALVGITFQFFINMEIERYALVRGESVFVGIYSIVRWAPYWFIVSTFIGFGLPGIIAASASVVAHIFGIASFQWVAIGFLIFIGLILSFGTTVYGLMEKVTKTIILLGVPFVFGLALLVSPPQAWEALARGMVGIGDGYFLLPAGISLATFFAAFAYSGAGGNLNLTQSIYIKEKGYGMGAYAQKIAGLFTQKGKEQRVRLEGERFVPNVENMNRFKEWWRLINKEHALVFWFMGALSILLLMLLSYSTAFGAGDNKEGINFVINEGKRITAMVAPLAGTVFLVVVSVMLFQTQLGVMDSTSRIMAENLALTVIKRSGKSVVNLSHIYYSFLWAQIAFGCLLFLLRIHEPRSLIVLGALINAFAMFIHIGLVFAANHRLLPVSCRPGWFRTIFLTVIFLFFGFFSGFVLYDHLAKLL